MEEPTNTGNYKITIYHQLAVGQNVVGTCHSKYKSAGLKSPPH
jgi:hypothetical protein